LPVSIKVDESVSSIDEREAKWLCAEESELSAEDGGAVC
jgi:hypothetical protein